MTTSGSTTYTLTVANLIQNALEDNGIIDAGETPTTNEYTACMNRLNGLIKTSQMQGLLWKRETISVTTTASVASVSLATYVRGVNGARYVESSTNEMPMVRWERDEYYSLPNKASSGNPTIYFVDRQDTGLVLYFWEVPSSAATIKLDIDRKLDTVTATTETVDIPEELNEMMWTQLAVRCAGVFGRQASPELVDRARTVTQLAMDNYRPASYMLGGV